MGRMNMIHAYAAGGATDYRALVCIFLFGGNDSNNMIIPNDTAGYQNYSTIRSNLALAQNTLLPIVAKTGNVPYGLHPQLSSTQAFNRESSLQFSVNVNSSRMLNGGRNICRAWSCRLVNFFHIPTSKGVSATGKFLRVQQHRLGWPHGG